MGTRKFAIQIIFCDRCDRELKNGETIFNTNIVKKSGRPYQTPTRYVDMCQTCLDKALVAEQHHMADGGKREIQFNQSIVNDDLRAQLGHK